MVNLPNKPLSKYILMTVMDLFPGSSVIFCHSLNFCLFRSGNYPLANLRPRSIKCTVNYEKLHKGFRAS